MLFYISLLTMKLSVAFGPVCSRLYHLVPFKLKNYKKLLKLTFFLHFVLGSGSTKSLNPDLNRIRIHNPGASSYTFEFTHPEANECGSGSAAIIFLVLGI
jgi:hypothetical protein